MSVGDADVTVEPSGFPSANGGQDFVEALEGDVVDVVFLAMPDQLAFGENNVRHLGQAGVRFAVSNEDDGAAANAGKFLGDGAFADAVSSAAVFLSQWKAEDKAIGRHEFKAIREYRHALQAGLTQGDPGAEIKAVADDRHLGKVADMLVKSTEMRIEADTAEKIDEGDVIGANQRDLFAHAFEGADLSGAPFGFQQFPGRVGVFFQQGIDRVLGCYGAVEINREEHVSLS